MRLSLMQIKAAARVVRARQSLLKAEAAAFSLDVEVEHSQTLPVMENTLLREKLALHESEIQVLRNQSRPGKVDDLLSEISRNGNVLPYRLCVRDQKIGTLKLIREEAGLSIAAAKFIMDATWPKS